MGAFRLDCEVANIRQDAPSVAIKDVLVDTGSEYSWFPADLLSQAGVSVRKKALPFVMPNGQEITRDIGYALIRCGGFETVYEVILGREGDLVLMGARTLEGFAAVVDPQRKQLVAAGPLPAAFGRQTPDETT